MPNQKPRTPIRSGSTSKKLMLCLKNLQAKKSLPSNEENSPVQIIETDRLKKIQDDPKNFREATHRYSIVKLDLTNNNVTSNLNQNAITNNHKESTIMQMQQSVTNLNQLKIGKITDYVIGAQIGQGAYAVVKHGTHKMTGRKVAIKIYEKYKLIEPQRKISVKREIQILKRLNHPNILKLHETIDTTRQLFLITELIKGKSLYNYVHSKPLRRLEENEAIVLFKQILEAVDHCHKNYVSHRDIKAENILVTQEGNAKLIDFGFSISAAITQKLKVFCGTPSYMSPEIVNRKEYLGPNADMWATGVLYYFMLAGNVPFRGPTERELFRVISRGLIAFPAYFSDFSKNIIQKILQVDPNKRPSASDILNMINNSQDVIRRQYQSDTKDSPNVHKNSN